MRCVWPLTCQLYAGERCVGNSQGVIPCLAGPIDGATAVNTEVGSAQEPPCRLRLEGETETVASPVLDVWVKLDCALDALNQERERTNIEKGNVLLTRCLLESPVIFILLLMFNVVPAGTVTVAQLCMAETSVGASSLPAPAVVTEQGTVARSVTPVALAAIGRIKRQLQTNATVTSLELEGRI
jgi:hypothetical protein